MVDFFSYFCPIRKYSKYILDVTFRWEWNDTSSLMGLNGFILDSY